MELKDLARGRKGQTALEGAFVVLFIILAVGLVMGFVVKYSSNMQKMAEARSIAQGVALEMTMEGDTTHLVRVDPADEDNGAIYTIKVWALSEECDDFEGVLRGRLPLADGLDGFKCSDELFWDTDFP